MDQSPLHELEADGEGDDLQDDDGNEVEDQPGGIFAGKDGPGDLHGVGQRQELGEGLHPFRELVEGEEDAGEEEHRGEDELGVVVEEVEVRGERRHDHGQRGEQDADEDHEDEAQQDGGHGGREDAHEHGHDHHQGPADQAPEDRPGDVAGDGVLGRDRRRDEGVVEPLVDHLDERPVQALEGRGQHHRGDQDARDEEVEIGLAAEEPHVGAHPDAEGDEVEERLDQAGDERREDEPLVGDEVPEEDVGDAVGEVHSMRLRPVSFRKTSSRVAGRWTVLGRSSSASLRRARARPGSRRRACRRRARGRRTSRRARR